MNDTDAPPDAPPPAAELPHENPNRPREYHGARTLIAGAGVVLAVAAALWLALLQPSRDGGSGGPVPLPDWLPADGLAVGAQTGRLAPDFELETLDGGRFRLSDWRGQPLLLNFWASWCGPCRREVPALIRAQDQLAASGFTVVGINIEESQSVAQEFVSEFGIDYAVPMDYDGAVFRAYGGGGPSGPPRSFFIDPDGVIVRIWPGQAPDDVVEAHTAEFAAAYASDRSGQLPGLKSPPPLADGDGRDVGAAVGALAPDLLLAPIAEPHTRWRLSEQRGRALTLAFLPPGCLRCARALGLADDPMIDTAAGAVIVMEDERATEHRALRWARGIDAVYAPDGDLQLVRIDARGVILSISGMPP